MKKIITSKTRRAQQLVEFLLVAPFLMIILGLLVEYAYALNINMTLTQGLKEVTANMYHDVKPSDVTDIVATVQTNLETYLEDNNISVAAANNVKVTYAPVKDTTVFFASYKYTPLFTLPQMYFRFLPKEFNFVATSAVPTAFLNENNFDSSINTSRLSNIWSSGSKGVISDAAGRADMLFVEPVVAAGLLKPYRIRLWDGSVQPYTLDTGNGKLYICAGICVDSGKTFKTFYSTYSNIIFIRDAGVDGWCNVLNRALGESDALGYSRGNYDNMGVSKYNASVLSGDTKYSVTASGGKVFSYISFPLASADDISKLQ